MKTIELKGLEKNLYYEQLKNGLEIYLLPYDNMNDYFISYATKYGSDVLKFEVDGEEYTPPLGVAHYLEHKLFEEPDGEDPFAFFSLSGSDGNASTSYDNTQYICYGTKALKENLRYLLQFVNTPFFTKENVEKEKGIISEEIKMYNDIPDYKLEMRLRRNLYKNSPRKEDIAGSIEEITRITKEDLYKCYESFYSPNNMFILIAGKMDVEEVLTIIKEELEEKEKQPEPTIIQVKEPKEVVQKEETIYENIEVPKIGYGIKIPKSSLHLKDVEEDLYINMLTTILFGSASEFRERVREGQLLNDIYTEWEDTCGYKTFYLLATTTSPDELIKEIEYELENISIAKKTFERIKKVWIANEVKMIDNVAREQSNLFDDIIQYNKVIDDRIERIRKMDVKTLNTMIEKMDLSHRSILKMLDKNNKE